MSNKINWEQKAVEAIDAIAAKLGSGVDHFYPILIKQQYIEGFAAFLGSLSFLAISIIFLIVMLKKRGSYSAEFESQNDDFSPRGSFTLTLLITSSCTFLIALLIFSTNEVLTKIFNPEYHAFREIIEMMK